MLLQITKTIKHTPVENSPATNTTNIESILTGGSGTQFTTPEDYDTNLTNDFKVRDTIFKVYELYNGNTFTLSLSTLCTLERVSSMDIICVEGSDSQKKIPIRFTLTFDFGDGDTYVLGQMSNFAINNVLGLPKDDIIVSNIAVPVNKRAVLIVAIGAFTTNGTVPTE